jgi:hypothetical protein
LLLWQKLMMLCIATVVLLLQVQVPPAELFGIRFDAGNMLATLAIADCPDG